MQRQFSDDVLFLDPQDYILELIRQYPPFYQIT